MRDFSNVYTLPTVPAVYAFYSGGKGPQYVAYVGIAGNLKRRIAQHVIRKDSSVSTGTSAVALIPEQLTRIDWWTHQSFDETVSLKAAEMVAFEILQPALRSRGRDDKASKEVYQKTSFRKAMEVLFKDKPSGTCVFLTLSDAMKRILELEQRVEALEARIVRVTDNGEAK